MGKIVKLEKELINRISAGEVIVRPMNIVKELLENTLDSGADQIQIDINGLLKIQIRDNGCGIEKDDLSLLCERHATSKISSFSDLSKLNTFGFRGEALSSISTNSKIKVVTKTKDKPCGYSCEYENSVLVKGPSSCSSTTGTTIIVTDLFYNAPERKKTFKNMTEEYIFVLDLVQKYSINFIEVSFVCKRIGKEPDLSISKKDTCIDRIRTVYGKEIATQVVPLSILNDEFINLSIDGFVSTSSFSGKRPVFIFFVNQRLVEIETFKKKIKNTYNENSISKTNPFVFLSIRIEPKAIDVNIHPTKNKVTFLYEKEISEIVSDSIRKIIFSQSEAMKIDIKTVLKEKKNLPVKKKEVPSKKIRVDIKEDQIDKYVKKIISSPPISNSEVFESKPIKDETFPPLNLFFDEIDEECVKVPEFICSLREKKKKEADSFIQKKLHESVFIGLVNSKYAAIQIELELYLMEYGIIIENFFLNRFLFMFGNIFTKPIKKPIELSSLFSEKDGLSVTSVKILIDKRIMFKDYFGIEIDKEGIVYGMSSVLDDYLPSSDRIQEFFIQITKEIDWNTEKCLEVLIEKLSFLYTPKEEKITEEFLALITEKIFFQIKKTALNTFYSTKLYEKEIFKKICDTNDLYKTFCR